MKNVKGESALAERHRCKQGEEDGCSCGDMEVG